MNDKIKKLLTLALLDRLREFAILFVKSNSCMARHKRPGVIEVYGDLPGLWCDEIDLCTDKNDLVQTHNLRNVIDPGSFSDKEQAEAWARWLEKHARRIRLHWR